MPETTQGAWEGPRFDRWILRERTLLNPRSAGGPTYLAALEAEAAGSWEAGDIADIQPGAAADQPLREYSIASLPGDGCLQLVVRQAQRQDGSLGIGSGWLTAHAPLHGAVMLRIRANPEFRAPLDDRPLILISNGTGIAGLRALLKARVAADRRRNWLIFGERHRQHDFYFRDELSALNASGQLGMDLAFSRDQEARIYVQDRMREKADEIRAWVNEDALIAICGRVDGMARRSRRSSSKFWAMQACSS